LSSGERDQRRQTKLSMLGTNKLVSGEFAKIVLLKLSSGECGQKNISLNDKNIKITLTKHNKTHCNFGQLNK
jgi:hypothetical protein